MTLLKYRNDELSGRLVPEFPQDAETSLQALSDAMNFDYGNPADAEAPNVEASTVIREDAEIPEHKPEHKNAELARTNRVLLGMSFSALVLLAPSFTVGYFSGYSSARSGVPRSASKPALIASTQEAPPASAAPQQPARTELRKPAAPVRAKERVSAPPADRPAAGQVYLQVVATAKSRSHSVVDSLRDKGFTAVVSEIPQTPGLARVLVGPLREADLDNTRADLQSQGFSGNSAIKRTF